MAFLKTVGCECPDCGPDECTGGCPCDVSVSDTGVNVGYDQTFNLNSSGDPLGNDASLVIDYDMDTVIADQMRVYIDGVLAYDSGCVLNTGGTTITVPAGSTTVRVVIIDDCTAVGLGTNWAFSIACA
jgi:hypothetical protein